MKHSLTSFAAIVLLICVAEQGLAQLAPNNTRAPQRVANNRPQRLPAQPAPPFTLTPAQQQRIDQILTFWHQKSEAISTYACDFTEWEYDPQFGPQKDARTVSHGIIRYVAPDKGEYRVETIEHYTIARGPDGRVVPGAKPIYKAQPGEYGQHWICDGKTVFELDPKQKLLIERLLPPELHGKAIADGPLPFLFGADVNKLKARYWLREVQPNGPGQYWIEAYPKRKDDAANYKRVTLILDQKEFLPQGMVMILPDGKSRTTFQFSERKVNAPDFFKLFRGEFFQPKTPRGWKRVVDNMALGGGQPQPPRR